MLKEERRDSKGKEGDPVTNKEDLEELRVHWKRPTLHIIEQRLVYVSSRRGNFGYMKRVS